MTREKPVSAVNRLWHPSSLLGICIGLLAAAVVLALKSPVGSPVAYGPMMSECDGRIAAVAIQYVQGADFATPICRQFLAALPNDVKVYALCPDHAAAAELRSALGASGSRLIPILTGHAMTAWSRDRWIALLPGPSDPAGLLLAPNSENGADLWPQRLGDQRIARDLADFLGKDALHSDLYFDAGDLLADERCVFVGPGAIGRNIQHTCADSAELSRLIERQCRQRPILLPDAPGHHVGMFMMAAGDNRVVVGDPSLAAPLYSSSDLPGGADFSPETQARFDSVAKAAKEAGYRVTRIPCVPAADGKTYLTYVNGLIDQRSGRRTIYMPIFDGQDRLNAAGEEVWRSLGFTVVPINVTSAYRYFGTLHCLVNVIDKVN